MVKTKKNLIVKFSLILVIIVFFFGVLSYVQTEILSTSTGIDTNEICKNSTMTDIKYFKILSYNKLVGTAEMICVREKQNETTYHKLNLVKSDFDRKENWKIIYTQKVYEDGGFFWPVYI